MLILASASPRRRELLKLITEDFRVVARDTDETVEGARDPREMVEILARRKAQAVYTEEGGVVIGADTVIAVGDEILGKPRDEADAAAMLRRLSGRAHIVYTGVAIVDENGCGSFVEATEVRFAVLDERKIQDYIATGEPMDKAGAYGIQEKGARFVRGITGDFYTVMGLPVCRLAEKLEKIAGIT